MNSANDQSSSHSSFPAWTALVVSTLAIGLVLLTLSASMWQVGITIIPSDINWDQTTFFVLGLGFFIYGVRHAFVFDVDDEQDPKILRNRYLIGVGCALFLTSLVAATMIIGLGNSNSGRLKYLLVTLKDGDNVFDNLNRNTGQNKKEKPKSQTGQNPSESDSDSADDESEDDSLVTTTAKERYKMEAVTIQFVFAVVVSVGGVLFFVANQMRKDKEDEVDFDADEFWPNLWFRIGEAILFTLVLFIFFVLANSPVLLPIAAVLTGMFVTSGEKLMQNLSLRIFSAIEALIPIGAKPSATAPQITPNLRVADNKMNVVIKFDNPELQSNHDADVSFVVDYSVDGKSWKEVGSFSKTKFSFKVPETKRPIKFKIISANSRSFGKEHIFELSKEGLVEEKSS